MTNDFFKLGLVYWNYHEADSNHLLSYGNIRIFQTVNDGAAMPLHGLVIGMHNPLQRIQRHIADILVVVEQKSAKNVDRKNLKETKMTWNKLLVRRNVTE